MQPISFFQILQSFLPKQADTDRTVATKPQEKGEEELIAPPKDVWQKSNNSAIGESESQTAFLQFIQAHDARAKRTKKP